jgi:hypothetical protein
MKESFEVRPSQSPWPRVMRLLGVVALEDKIVQLESYNSHYNNHPKACQETQKGSAEDSTETLASKGLN